MSNTIKFRRGLELSLPTLADGEPAWCTDTFNLYVGSGGINKPVGGGAGVTNPLYLGTDDAVYGHLFLYGGGEASGQGGRIVLHTAASSDAVIDYYVVQVNLDDFLIGPVDDQDALKLDNNKNLYLTDGNVYVQEAGATRVSLQANPTSGWITVGVADTYGGGITVYGNGAASVAGGRLELQLAADHDATINEYIIAPYQDDLHIGTASYPDLLKLTAEMDLYLRSGSIVLPTSEYANFGGIQGSTGYGVRDNAGVMEFKDSGGSWAQFGRFVSRGDPVAWDFTVASFTKDGAWHDLDISSIVPAGTKLVHFQAVIQSTTAMRSFALRKKGFSNKANVYVYTQAANVPLMVHAWVECDANRYLQYYAENTSWTYIEVGINGWLV